MVWPSIRNSYPSSSTQKDSSSRCWTWGGGPAPGWVVTSKSEYAPPVCSLVVLYVTSSPNTHSERPSPDRTCVTPVSTSSSLVPKVPLLLGTSETLGRQEEPGMF